MELTLPPNDVIKKRIVRYDFARAICMLWIVGVWHMCSGYLGIIIDKNVYLSNITGGVLAVFFYMSGRLSARTTIHNKKEAFGFIKHRFLSIYPLYLLSAAIIIFYPISDLRDLIEKAKTFLVTAFCINAFVPPMVMTIWFLTILLLFYLITPIFIGKLSLKKRIIIAISIYAVLLFENLAFGSFDERIVEFFPFYIMGLFISNQIESKVLKLRNVLIALPVLVITLIISGKYKSMDLLLRPVHLILMVSFIICFLYICELLGRIQQLGRICYFLALSSTFAYLFHRQYYSVWNHFFKTFPIWLAYLVILPSLIVLSYFGQIIYSKAIKKIEKRE